MKFVVARGGALEIRTEDDKYPGLSPRPSVILFDGNKFSFTQDTDSTKGAMMMFFKTMSATHAKRSH